MTHAGTSRGYAGMDWSDWQYRPRQVLRPETRDLVRDLLGRRARPKTKDGRDYLRAHHAGVRRKSDGWVGFAHVNGQRYQTPVVRSQEMDELMLPEFIKMVEALLGLAPPPPKDE